MKKDLKTLQEELSILKKDNPRLSAHYSPVPDGNRWLILMHKPEENFGHDCDDAKQEDVAYNKAISWMKKEIKGYLYELKHPIN